MNKQQTTFITPAKQRGSAIIFVVLAIIIASVLSAVFFIEKKEAPEVKPTPMQFSQNKTQQTENKALPEVTVYKSETCDCCNKWITHLENEGFKVVAHNTNDINTIKQKAGLTPALASCHTALVGDYVIEGHVPASDIKRLLKQQMDIVGLTAPGMPQASPGMQPEGMPPRGYDVIAFDKEGNTMVFNRY